MTRLEYAGIWIEMKFFSFSRYLRERKEKKRTKDNDKEEVFS